MKIIKNITHLLFTCAILTITSNSWSMDELPKPEVKKRSKLERLGQLATIMGQIVLGKVPVRQLQEEHNAFLFEDLPKDIKNIIIGLLITGANAESLDIAAYTITELAQVNKEFNQLINRPDYCLAIIASLSKRFNCPNMQACAALGTKQAKHQLNLQKQLFDLCMQKEPNEHLFVLLCSQGADLYFTYDYKKQQLTPFMIAALNSSDMVSFLIKAGVDINHTNQYGLTTLMLLAGSNYWWALGILFNSPQLAINQTDAEGNTALMYAINKNTIGPVLNNIARLLTAGADPLQPNKKGLTPLAWAQQLENKAVIDLIQNFLDKKNEKK